MITVPNGIKFDVPADGLYPSADGLPYAGGVTTIIVAHVKDKTHRATVTIEISRDGGATWTPGYPMPTHHRNALRYINVANVGPVRLRLNVVGAVEPFMITMRNR